MQEATTFGKGDDDAKASTSGACSEYRVNLVAMRFGDCQCGFTRAEHTSSARRARYKGGHGIERIC